MMGENIDELLTMAKDCQKRYSKLSEWEQGFIDSILNRLSAGKPITQKQEERLSIIWDKATAGG